MNLDDFKNIFDNYYTPVKNYLYYKCGDTNLSEDVTQDAFIKLWDKRESIDQKTVKSYLYTIANNMLLNKIRHEKVVLSFIQKNEHPLQENSPEYELEVKEFKIRFEQIIASMPTKQREVFLMNRIDELTYKEIAERLDLTVKAIEKRMSGALKHLKNYICFNI